MAPGDVSSAIRAEGSTTLHQRLTRPAVATLDAEDVLGGLERILANGDFDASPRSRAFIRFIVEETLAGRQEGLTQAAIATRVFGRRDDFDPTVDPIVRIQAGRLRRSLERYYLLSGAHDPVRIELPRGTYIPVLRWATPPEKAAAERSPAAVEDWPVVVVLPFESAPHGPELDEALPVPRTAGRRDGPLP